MQVSLIQDLPFAQCVLPRIVVSCDAYATSAVLFIRFIPPLLIPFPWLSPSGYCCDIPRRRPYSVTTAVMMVQMLTSPPPLVMAAVAVLVGMVVQETAPLGLLRRVAGLVLAAAVVSERAASEAAVQALVVALAYVVVAKSRRGDRQSSSLPRYRHSSK